MYIYTYIYHTSELLFQNFLVKYLMKQSKFDEIIKRSKISNK